jgi:DNA (cytosine-5)-methyltransferase 1
MGVKKWGVAELFAGTVGVGQGFVEQGNFELLSVSDIDQDAKDTYVENYPDFKKRYIREDIANISGKTLKDAAGGSKIHGLLGCPPCQGFSSAGKRDPNDERNKLMNDYIRFVRELKPRFFVLENVPRILRDASFTEGLKFLREEFHYQIWTGVLNAALYGLPQTRQRAIVIGLDASFGFSPIPPSPTHCGSQLVFDYASQKMISPAKQDGWDALGFYPEFRRSNDFIDWVSLFKEDPSKLMPLVTVEQAIDDLPSLQAGEKSTAKGIHNHKAWNHNAEFVKRLSQIEEGKNEEGNGRCKKYFSQAYGRLHRSGLARTITSNFHNPGCGRYTHYRDHRAITVREAARLQGFSDSFVFSKTQKVQERLVGNAFPKPLALAIANQLYKQIGNP